ncbi:MAG: Smr/MutS family protein [Deltaproteobacteria bacterium]|nr:Smr/MutS family protein [Deltaproteobacteria bacterium]
MEDFDGMEPVIVDLEDVIDLHTFRPADVPDLLNEYIRACAEKGYASVRIVHGKGRGILKKRVEKILARHPRVTSFHPAPLEAGGWGATIAVLK